jgi:hypothetical protein
MNIYIHEDFFLGTTYRLIAANTKEEAEKILFIEVGDDIHSNLTLANDIQTNVKTPQILYTF